MTGSMYAAVAGLRAHMGALNVIGNNVSNVNTTGYKSARYTFNEALYTTMRTGSNGTRQLGGRNPAQIGYGCSIGTIDIDMSTKNYNPTGYALDCMIDGDGFFLVGNKQPEGITTQDQLQGMNLTRMGNFEFKDGYLVDGEGSVVYGFLRLRSKGAEEEIPDTGEPADLTSPILTPIRLPNCRLLADGTTEIFYPGVNEEGTSVLDTETAEEEREDAGEIERLQPNSISIDTTGAITCVTKDGQQVIVGYIALGAVDSPNGVTHVDGRYYMAMGGAGNVHLTSIGGAVQYVYSAENEGDDNGLNTQLSIESAGDTELVTGGLESSGTDLAMEITNMIVIQRGYQANTRIVTVTDSMLEELVNMKR